MPRSIPALVEPALLVWPRKTAGLTTEEAAKKAQTAPAQLAAWEAGVDYPSIPKLRLLGVAYKRPIAVFYLAEPPQDFAPLKDFRRLPQEGSRRQSPAVFLNERRALSRRYAALELYSEVEGDPPAFDLDASLDEDPERVGARLREWVEVELAEQFRWGTVELLG
jgi:transcriptional regulator with XRE-family HTH domain